MKNLAQLLGLNNSIAANVADAVPMPENDHSLAAQEIQQVSIDAIAPNPYQPRKTFTDEGLADLAASIREFGIIQPLLVRRTADGIELIAGERRLRAARLAGLSTVPAIFRDLSEKEMAELAMIENLQREDLHFLEEAEGFQQLLHNFGFTQEELAQRVGKNQSTIANKLRLLKLSSAVRSVIVADNLTERHARALLKLEDPLMQASVLDTVRQKGLNVRETEDLIEEIIADISREMSKRKPGKQTVVKVIKDVRIFVNTINNVVSEMKKVGLPIQVHQVQDDDFITMTLRIPKRK